MVAAAKSKRQRAAESEELVIRVDRLEPTQFKMVGQLLVDFETTAKVLGTDHETVCDWSCEGYLPDFIDVCGTKVFRMVDILEWVRAGCPKLKPSVEENIAACKKMRDEWEQSEASK